LPGSRPLIAAAGFHRALNPEIRIRNNARLTIDLLVLSKNFIAPPYFIAVNQEMPALYFLGVSKRMG
jgi:hypothetical protein